MSISVGAVGIFSGATIGGARTSAPVNTAASGSGFIVIIPSENTSGNTFTISDTYNNTWTQLAEFQYHSGGATYNCDAFYVAPGATGYNGGGTGHTVTLTLNATSGAGYWCFALIEVPGAATGNSNFYNSDTSANYVYDAPGPYASTSLAVTPPVTGALLLSVMECEGPSSGTGSESTGFTTQFTAVLGSTVGFAIGTKIVSSAGTYTPSWSWSTSIYEGMTTLYAFFGGAAAPSNTAPIAWIS